MTNEPITDWDDAYANAPHIPGGAGYPARWAAAAAAFRAGAAGETGIAYGPGDRRKLDLFLPGGAAAGLAVFVHGGYWLKFGREDWSHLARGAVARGWAVALPSYPLAPAARIGGIVGEVAAAVTLAAGRVPGPVRLAGHSAGGQIVTRLVCTDSPLAEGVRARVARVVSISGVHDLRPLLRTAMAGPLGLDADEARRESPALCEPAPGVRLTCWAGADERPEFRRQNALLANIWTGLGAATEAVEEPARHHFDVIDGLCDPDSPLTAALTG